MAQKVLKERPLVRKKGFFHFFGKINKWESGGNFFKRKLMTGVFMFLSQSFLTFNIPQSSTDDVLRHWLDAELVENG